MIVSGERVQSNDSRLRLEGNLFERAPHITAVCNVLMQPRVLRNAGIPEHDALQMSGTAGDQAFNLIGTGPSGLIVEISCAYAGPLTDEQA